MFDQPFPYREFPPLILDAFMEAAYSIKAPDALIATTAIAASAAAIHAEFDVVRPNGMIGPTSIFAMTIAQSGERKSSVDREFFCVFQDFDNRNYQESWIGGQNKRFPRLMYADATPAAFIKGLQNNSPNAILREDEAGRIFCGKLMSDLATLNKCWGGDQISVSRMHREVCVTDPRVCISWMIQPEVFEKFMKKNGPQTEGLGFLARFLMAFPASKQGKRIVGDIGDLRFSPRDRAGITRWREKARQLLERQSEYHLQGPERKKKKRLFMSQEAESEFVAFQNEMERMLQDGADFCEHRGYASKVPENAARVAAVLHVFKNDESLEIQKSTIQSSINIARWYANEYRRIISPPPEEIARVLGGKLYNWLTSRVKNCGKNYIARNEVLQYGPVQLRQASNLELAEAFLISNGSVSVFYTQVDGFGRSTKPTRFIRVNFPAFLPSSGFNSGGL